MKRALPWAVAVILGLSACAAATVVVSACVLVGGNVILKVLEALPTPSPPVVVVVEEEPPADIGEPVFQRLIEQLPSPPPPSPPPPVPDFRARRFMSPDRYHPYESSRSYFDDAWTNPYPGYDHYGAF